MAQELRSDAATQGTRLVALSGYGQPQDRRRSAEVGFDEHLVKPPEVDELLRVIGGRAARAVRSRAGPTLTPAISLPREG